MRYLLYLSILLLLTGCYLTPKYYWSEQKPIKWKHFRGYINNDRQETKNVCGVNCFVDDSSRWFIAAFFDMSESWCLPMHGTNELLKHEQYYFNIAEIYARKIRKEVIDNGLEFGSLEFKRVFIEYSQKCDIAFSTYKRKTRNSKNKNVQKFWENDIKKQLELLKDYSNPIVGFVN